MKIIFIFLLGECMKEIIACLIFLIGGIYANSKLTIIESIIFLLLILLIDEYVKISKLNQDKNIKFKNFTSLTSSLYSMINARRLLLLLIFFIYGYTSSYMMNNHYNKRVSNILYKSMEFNTVVTNVEERETNYKVTLKIKDYYEKIQMYIDKEGNNRIYPGDQIRLKGIICNIDPKRNEGSYDEKEYKKQHRIYYNFQGTVTEIKEGKIFLLTSLYKIKYKICDFYDKILDKKYSGIIKAMIVGEDSLIDENVKDLYKNGGIFHILAISGMHVGILVGFMKKLLKNLHINKKCKVIFLVSILFGYVVLTGASISTIRAALMITFSELAVIFNRDYNSTYGLCLAAIIILMFNPMSLFNISFILSFSAIVAMKCKLNIKGLLENQSGNISIFILMTPIIIFLFYGFQGLSILANIFILPLTSILVLSSFACIFFSFININVSVGLGKLITIILTYYESVLTYLSKIAFYNNIVGKLSLFQILMWYVSYYFIYKYLKTSNIKIVDKRNRLKYIKYFLVSLAILLMTFVIKSNDILITFIDVSHGDSILVYDKGEDVSMIIDGGGSNNNPKDKGTYNVLPYLKYLGLTKIDIAVVTHQDRDHIKGIIELLDLIDIRKVALPCGTYTSNYYEELIKKCNEKNIDVVRLKYGDTFNIGKCKCDVLYPYENIDTYNFDINNYSLVISMNVGNKNILFTGDIEEEAENLLLNNEFLNKNYYIAKIPHHGSNTSSTDSFVKIINPKFGIISGNKTNITNFNKKNVFKYKNSVIMDTYYSGMITFAMKG